MEGKRLEGEGKCEIQQVRKKISDRMRKQQLHQIFQEKRRELLQPHRVQKIEEEINEQQIQQPSPNQYIQKKTPNYGYVRRMNLMQSYTIFNYVEHLASVFPPIIPTQPQPNIMTEKNGIVIYKKLLGSGSASKVWQGKIRSSGQKIAAKQIKKLQINELKCLQELQSPHIVKIIDTFDRFIILEYCDRNLREELQVCNYQLKTIMKYFEGILIGMDLLQSRNIIHRDLKFENILVKNGIVKIADFGLAKFLGDELQVESRRCGTPYTMAPEIFFSYGHGLYTIKSDIWSIGVILHQMLYKIHPFNHCSRSLRKYSRVKIAKRFGVLDKIIDGCLQYIPSCRIEWGPLKQLFGFYLEDKSNYLARELNPFPPPLILQNNKFQQEEQKRRIRQLKRKEYYYKKQLMQKEQLRRCQQLRERTPKCERIIQQKQQHKRNKFQEKMNKYDEGKRKYRFENEKAVGLKNLENKKDQLKPIQVQKNQIIKRPEVVEQKLKNRVLKVSVGQFTIQVMTIMAICTFLFYFFW